MELREQLAHFRREHDSFLLFLREFESALSQASDPAGEKRQAGVARLRALEPQFAEIRRHCREEERAVEVPSLVDEEAMDRLLADHELFEKLVAGFRLELRRIGSLPPREETFVAGRSLLSHLRHHIAFEEGVLKQVEDATAASAAEGSAAGKSRGR